MPCRASSHHAKRPAQDKCKEWERFERRPAPCAHHSTVATGGLFFLGGMNFCGDSGVGPNPRTRKPTVSIDSRISARRKSPFAGPGSALNRRSRAHIGGLHGDQTVFDKMIQKIG
jgi:hypothetical protein